MSVQSLDGEDALEMGTAPAPVFLLENPMGRGAWRTTVCRVAELDTTKVT